MAVIQTTGLSKRYGDKWAVDGLDLQVEQGDIYGFIGPNGAGKSTTLRILCGLARPTRGEVRIFDRPVRDRAARRRATVSLTGRSKINTSPCVGLARPHRSFSVVDLPAPFWPIKP